MTPQKSIFKQTPGGIKKWKAKTFRTVYSAKKKKYDGSVTVKEFIKSCATKTENPPRFDKDIKIFTMPCSSYERRANGKFNPYIYKEGPLSLYKEDLSLRLQIIETMYRLFLEITLDPWK
jgi:hypothetical protein